MALKKKHIPVFIVTLFFLLGIFIRSYDLGKQSIWIDEGFSLNSALSIQEKGIPVLDSNRWYTNSFINSYIIAFAINNNFYSPFNPWVARIPSVLFGSLLIFLGYFAYKYFYTDTRGALIYSFILTFSSWEIAWSRQVRGYTIASFFVLVLVTFFWKFFKDRNKSLLIISLISLLIAIFSQWSALAVLAGFLFYGLYNLFLYIKLSNVRSFIYSSLLFLSIVFASSFYINDRLFKSIIFYHYYSPDNILLFVYGSLLFLSYCLFKKDTKKFSLYLPMVTLGSVISLVFITSSLQIRYLFIFYPLLILCSVRIFLIIYDNLLIQLKRFYKNIYIGLLVGLFIFPYSTFLPKSKYLLDPGSPQPDFKSVFDYILKNKDSGDVVVSGYSHLHKVFLGQKGIWLKMVLNEGQKGADKKVVNDREFYVDAPVIYNEEDLLKVLNEKKGFVVVDNMTRSRLYWLFPLLENTDNIKRVASFEGLVGDKIYLYRF